MAGAAGDGAGLSLAPALPTVDDRGGEVFVMNRSLFVAALALSACGTAGEQDAAEALDSVEVAVSESALLATGADDLMMTAPATAEELAQGAGAKWTTYFTPAGCATETYSGATVTYRLNNCTGPYGLLRATGTLTATYALRPGGFRVTLASTGFKVNSASVDVDAVGDYTVSGATRTLTVTGKSSGTGSRGFTVTRDGNYTVTADATCVTLNGTWMTTIGARGWTTTVAGFKQCTGMCPAAGASLVVMGRVNRLTTTVTTNGSDTAAWSTSNGKSGTINLVCAK
jgi:hypothetical protein